MTTTKRFNDHGLCGSNPQHPLTRHGAQHEQSGTPPLSLRSVSAWSITFPPAPQMPLRVSATFSTTTRPPTLPIARAAFLASTANSCTHTHTRHQPNHSTSVASITVGAACRLVPACPYCLVGGCRQLSTCAMRCGAPTPGPATQSPPPPTAAPGCPPSAIATPAQPRTNRAPPNHFRMMDVVQFHRPPPPPTSGVLREGSTPPSCCADHCPSGVQ